MNTGSQPPTEAETTLYSDRWQRLSPIAIIYFAASGIKGAANNLIYLLPAFAVSYSSIKENPGTWLPILAAVIALICIASVLQYLFYSFRLEKSSVEIRYGVFSKKHVNLPFDRIQNVTIEQPLYYRLTNTSCLQLDTAGSAKQEAKIVALPQLFAEQLKQRILLQANAQSEDTQTDDTLGQSFESEDILNTRSTGDLVIHGITNNRVWIILGVLAPLYDDLASFIGAYIESMGFDYQQYFDTQAQPLWQFALAILALAFMFIVSVTLLSILGSIILFYDFKLSKTNGRYIRRSGLFTRQEVTMRLSRLQLIALKQDWLDVILRRVNLELKQNDAGVRNTQGQSTANKILVPSVTVSEALEITEDAFDHNQLAKVEFTPISYRFIFRQLLTWVLPLFAILSTIAISQQNYLGAAYVAVGACVVMIMVWCRWKRWGFASDNEYIYVRKGLFGVDKMCFPKYKVQQTQFIQSKLMKAKQLASVRIILASGSVSIPFIEQKQAAQLLQNTLHEVSFSQRSWM